MVMKRTTYQQCGKERDVSVMSQSPKVLSPDPKIRNSYWNNTKSNVFFRQYTEAEGGC